MVVLFYMLAFIFYMWVRITKTLDLGPYLGYGIFVLIVEIMGATSTISYGINLIWSPVNPPLAEDPANPGLPKVRCSGAELPWHLHKLCFCFWLLCRPGLSSCSRSA